MGIVTWVLVGLVAGFIASLVMGRNNTIANLVVGVAGAGLAGWLATWFGWGTLMAFHWINLLISIGGAIVLLALFALAQRGREA